MSKRFSGPAPRCTCFSALQRAEIAEISSAAVCAIKRSCFSALQRAEIAEIRDNTSNAADAPYCFSALQRAEIAEIISARTRVRAVAVVSVLFNEPKLLKSRLQPTYAVSSPARFSALQRAEIAEIVQHVRRFGALLLRFSALQRAEIAEI